MKMRDEEPLDIQQVAFNLLSGTRSMGLELGSDLALVLAYLRWWTSERLPTLGWAEVSSAVDGSEQPRLEMLWQMLAEDLSRRTGKSLELPPLREDGGEAMYFAETTIDGVPPTEIPELFEAILAARRLRLSRAHAETETSPEIARMLVACLPPGGFSTVLDPACGIGTCLIEAARAGAQVVHGMEVNGWAAAIARMRLDLAEVDGRIECVDSLTTPDWARAEAVIVDPPSGQRLSDEDRMRLVEQRPGIPAPRTADMLWAHLALRNVRPGGRVVASLPMTVGFRDPTEHAMKGDLLVSGQLEAWVALPADRLRKSSTRSVAWTLVRDQTVPERILIVDLGLVEAEHTLDDLSDAAIWDVIRTALHEYRAFVDEMSLPGYIAERVDRENALMAATPLAAMSQEPPSVQLEQPAPPRRLLTELRIEGLKSFGSYEKLELAPITLLYGPNSAGKSSILQSLLLIKQSLGLPTLVTQGSATDAGSFRGLIHRHETERPLRLGVTYGTLDRWAHPDGVPNPELLRFVDFSFFAEGSSPPRLNDVYVKLGPHDLELSRYQTAPHFELVDTRETFEALADWGFLWRAKDIGKARADTPGKRRSRVSNARRAARNLGPQEKLHFEVDGLLPGRPILDLRHLAGTEREVGLVESYAGRTAQLFAGVNTELRALFDELQHLGPLRSKPQRFYDRAAAAAGTGSIGDRFALHLFDNRTDRELLNVWLDRLYVPYTVDVVPLAAGRTNVLGDMVALVLTDRRTGVQVSPLDVGFGISQVLPVVVELLVGEEQVVCIEQPEIHLHPKLQTELGDLLIAATSPDGPANQVIVETHSEHLLLRLQRRIREGGLSPDDVAVQYVQQLGEQGAGVQRLRLGADGTFLDPWPAGFFEESLDEILGGLE